MPGLGSFLRASGCLAGCTMHRCRNVEAARCEVKMDGGWTDTSTLAFGKSRSGACTKRRLPIGDIRELEVKIRTVSA